VMKPLEMRNNKKPPSGGFFHLKLRKKIN